MKRRHILLGLTGAALATSLSGCDMLKEASAIRDDIKNELGVDANVGVNVNNGDKTVNVTLSSTPKGEAAEIKQKVEAIVKKHAGEKAKLALTM